MFKYFQCLGLLYTEIILDRLTTEPIAFLDDLELWVRLVNPRPPLPIPAPRAGYRVEDETWALAAAPRPWAHLPS